MIASHEAAINTALLVWAPEKDQPGLNFGPDRDSGPELCIYITYTSEQIGMINNGNQKTSFENRYP